jgi:hypothetical protein
LVALNPPCLVLKFRWGTEEETPLAQHWGSWSFLGGVTKRELGNEEAGSWSFLGGVTKRELGNEGALVVSISCPPKAKGLTFC